MGLPPHSPANFLYERLAALEEVAKVARERENFCRCTLEFSCGEPTTESERRNALAEAIAKLDALGEAPPGTAHKITEEDP